MKLSLAVLELLHVDRNIRKKFLTRIEKLGRKIESFLKVAVRTPGTFSTTRS
jgi:hypothetical protein